MEQQKSVLDKTMKALERGGMMAPDIGENLGGLFLGAAAGVFPIQLGALCALFRREKLPVCCMCWDAARDTCWPADLGGCLRF